MTRERRSQIRIVAALGLLAALNIAARPGSPLQDGEIVIRGIVYHDANSNQRKDARERGLANMSVISQAADAQGGAVNASTVTMADGSFTIQTRVGDRVSIVPGAGYKAMQASTVAIREGMQELSFPLYVDKVVVDRVIRMEPAAVNIPAAQVYVSPQITVPAPVVNIQPAEVHIAPAEVVVQPAPVLVAPAIDLATLWAAVAAISLSSLIGAGLIGQAIRAHARTLCDVAAFEASNSACRVRVNEANWKGIAEQVIADAIGRAIYVEALVSISAQPVPIMRFRTTDSCVFVFSLGRKVDDPQARSVRSKRIAGMKQLAAVVELRELWHFFAESMRLPSQLPRARQWYIAVVSTNKMRADRQVGSECAKFLHPEPSVSPEGTDAVECLTQNCRNLAGVARSPAMEPQVAPATETCEPVSNRNLAEEHA